MVALTTTNPAWLTQNKIIRSKFMDSKEVLQGIQLYPFDFIIRF